MSSSALGTWINKKLVWHPQITILPPPLPPWMHVFYQDLPKSYWASLQTSAKEGSLCHPKFSMSVNTAVFFLRLFDSHIYHHALQHIWIYGPNED